MIVNVEFFDKNPLENVITALNYRIHKTLFFCYHTVPSEERKCVERFLKKTCKVREVEFVMVDPADLFGMKQMISEKVRKERLAGHEVFFDLTGGRSMMMAAFGMVAEELQAPMHLFHVTKNKLHEYGGETLFSQAAEHCPIALDLDDLVALHGGVINYRMHKNFKSTWSDEDVKDILSMWKLSRKYEKQWVHYSALFRKFPPNESGYVQVEERQVLAEFRRDSSLGKVERFHAFLEDCERAGFLKTVSYEDIYRYTYKSETIRNYMWDGGSILEMYALVKESEGNATDCRVGVHIDWDGVIYNKPGKDVLNEIDILSIEGNIPTFISCKIGNVDQMALYELQTVAERFGGKYAKKVLVVAKDVAPGHLERAREMGIEVRKY